jgi:fengycin family lipopeptide synthetase A
LQHKDVKEVVVLVKEGVEYEKYLCAYIAGDKGLDSLKLRTYLRESLPEYMIPSYFTFIDKIPITANGKIDRKALLKISTSTTKCSQENLPRNKIEEKLYDTWCEVLERKDIGIYDNFFDLGGHSLSLLKLTSKINNEFKIKIDLGAIYRMPTISLISKYIIDSKYRIKSEEDNVILLNTKMEKNIFAFPPMSSFAISYSELSMLISSYSFYAFNFIENENLIGEYVRLILDIQNQGPFILFGYSLGGNVAFEVAAELERQGHEVSDIILLDSSKREDKKAKTISNELKINMLLEEAKNDEFYKQYLQIEDIRENAIKRIRKYLEYSDTMVNNEIINANIHLIKGETGATENVKISCWKELTNNKFKTYTGFGRHEEMLYNNNLKNNCVKINEILNSIS